MISCLLNSVPKPYYVSALLADSLFPSLFFRAGSSAAEPEGAAAAAMVTRAAKAVADSPKKVADLVDLANLPSTLREFMGQSQISRLGCFIRVWSYIKDHKLQDPSNKNMVNCDDKLKRILLGKPRVDLAELPMLVKLHFPMKSK